MTQWNCRWASVSVGGYLFNASYVYSRLWGNYSGLQSTDEIRPATLGYAFGGNQAFFAQTYRPGGNANRYFDLDEAVFDAHGHDGLFGRLPTDRPHVFKFYGSKTLKFGTEIGGFFRACRLIRILADLDSGFIRECNLELCVGIPSLGFLEKPGKVAYRSRRAVESESHFTRLAPEAGKSSEQEHAHQRAISKSHD